MKPQLAFWQDSTRQICSQRGRTPSLRPSPGQYSPRLAVGRRPRRPEPRPFPRGPGRRSPGLGSVPGAVCREEPLPGPRAAKNDHRPPAVSRAVGGRVPIPRLGGLPRGGQRSPAGGLPGPTPLGKAWQSSPAVR